MVIPLADRNPTTRRPWITRALVLLNVAVFVALTPWASTACDQVAFFQDWAAVPQEIAQAAPLSTTQQSGTPADACGLEPASDKNVLVSIVTSLFLHGGWLHLLLNMLYLVIFGNNVEDRFGHLGFLGFYLLAGTAATLVFAAANLHETTALVGASGAIAGVLGAYLVMFPRARIYASVPFLLFLVLPLPAAFVLVLWFIGQIGALRMGELAGTQVAYLAHVAGFVFGMGLTYMTQGQSRQRQRRASRSGRSRRGRKRRTR